MRFHVVMLKTMGDLMGLRRTVGLIAGGLLLPVFMCLVDWQETFRSGTMSLYAVRTTHCSPASGTRVTASRDMA